MMDRSATEETGRASRWDWASTDAEAPTHQYPIELVDRLDVALLLFGLEDGKLAWANHSARRLLGPPQEGSREQGLEAEAYQNLFDDRARRDLARWARDGEGSESLPIERRTVQRMTGHSSLIVDMAIVPVRTPDGVLVLARLDPVRSASTSQATEAEERYETLVEQAPDPIGVHREGELIFANPAAADLLGFEHPAQLVGENVLTFVHPDERDIARERMARLARGESVRPMLYRLVTQDGEQRQAEVTASRILYEGQPATQLALRDVTERSQPSGGAAEELSQVYEDLEAFTDAISHDLRTPLETLQQYLDRITERVDADEETETELRHARKTAERMSSMLDGILEHSRLSAERTQLEPVDLRSVVEDALAGLEVRLKTSDASVDVGQLPEVRGDRNQLIRVFQNLFSNAVKYSGDQPPRIKVVACAHSDRYEVRVRDQGEGMEPEETEKVLERFERLDRPGEGSGVGLSLCARILEEHCGEMELDSQPGEGTTVTVTFPRGGAD